MMGHTVYCCRKVSDSILNFEHLLSVISDCEVGTYTSTVTRCEVFMAACVQIAVL